MTIGARSGRAGRSGTSDRRLVAVARVARRGRERSGGAAPPPGARPRRLVGAAARLGEGEVLALELGQGVASRVSGGRGGLASRGRTYWPAGPGLGRCRAGLRSGCASRSPGRESPSRRSPCPAIAIPAISNVSIIRPSPARWPGARTVPIRCPRAVARGAGFRGGAPARRAIPNGVSDFLTLRSDARPETGLPACARAAARGLPSGAAVPAPPRRGDPTDAQSRPRPRRPRRRPRRPHRAAALDAGARARRALGRLGRDRGDRRSTSPRGWAPGSSSSACGRASA